MNYRTISDLNNIILKRLHTVSRDIDLIVGVPRSGMLPANLLALYLNKPFTDIDSFIAGHIFKCGARGQFIDNKEFRKVLVIDDSISSGRAMIEVKEKLAERERDFEIIYSVVYMVSGKEEMVDHYFEMVALPRCFQWNILNHTILEKSCFDIDGVLCVDPTTEQNDDGERYIDFLLNATPLYIPGAKIGTLVTSRLEKYRPQTEEWLRRNGVKYDKLIMLDAPDMQARQRMNCHGSFKASEYKKSRYSLFVESEPHQAAQINQLTGKPVLCSANFEMIFDSQSLLYSIKRGQKFPLIHRVALKLRRLIKG